MKLVYDLTYKELEGFLLERGIKKYRAEQIWQWLYVHKVSEFSQMKNVPQEVIELLNTHFFLLGLIEKTSLVSSDGTVKKLYSLNDNHLIETVLMKHDYGNSICVTTQVGCNIGCLFCASGQLKKKRDLTSGEITAQIIAMERSEKLRVSSVVVMGIGEPFDNFPNLLKFIDVINHDKGLAIGARHITISTSGIVPRIKDFAHIGVQVNLAISLHAPNNDIRSSIMPINKRYPIEAVMDTVRYYIQKTNRRVTIEYILLKGINDQPQHAAELIKLISKMNIYVNLIPYNAVQGSPYERSNEKTMDEFYQLLSKSNIRTTLRREQGHDIEAACGQLRSNNILEEIS